MKEKSFCPSLALLLSLSSRLLVLQIMLILGCANVGAKNICVVAIWRCLHNKGLPTRAPSYAKVAARSIH